MKQGDRMIELRVLTGTHAGARALLAAQPQRLGQGENCDLILSDEGVLPQHARLEAQAEGEGGVLLHWEDGHAPALLLQPGDGVAIGPVLVAIDHADAPWRDAVTLRTPEPGTGEDAPPPASPAAASAPQALPGVSHRSLAPGGRRRAAVIAVLAVAAAGAFMWSIRRPGMPEPAAVVTPVHPVDPRQAVQRALAHLPLSGRVRIELAPDGTALVRARLPSDDEAEALALALARLSPRPGLVLLTERELLAAVTDFVARRAAENGRPLRARALGDGRFAVDGLVADDSQRNQLQADLAAALGGEATFEWQVATLPEAAGALVEDLRQAGFPQVDGRWSESDAVAALDVALDEAQLRRWEQALVRVARRHEIPFRVTLRLRPTLARETPYAGPAIRSIVGGPQPYVVLADGRKLLPGGEAEGWRLVEVLARSIVLESPRGERITLER